MKRRAAIIQLGYADIHKMLTLPEDVHVMSMNFDHRRFTIDITVTGEGLREVEEFAEPPIIPGKWNVLVWEPEETDAQ